jgi:hypothetical protein
VTYGDLTSEARPEVYIRIVRPNSGEDVGGFHKDHWYTQLYTPQKRDAESVKLWIALQVPPGAGLRFAPEVSASASYFVERTPEGPRPRIKSIPPESAIVQPDINNGDGFIFGHNVLHSGSVNPGPLNRVSIELSFFRRS